MTTQPGFTLGAMEEASSRDWPAAQIIFTHRQMWRASTSMRIKDGTLSLATLTGELVCFQLGSLYIRKYLVACRVNSKIMKWSHFLFTCYLLLQLSSLWLCLLQRAAHRSLHVEWCVRAARVHKNKYETTFSTVDMGQYSHVPQQAANVKTVLDVALFHFVALRCLTGP